MCKLPVRNLSEGKHHQAFELQDDFGVEHGIEDISDLQLSVNAFFEKRKQVITGYIEIDGAGKMQCDRCLELCDVEFESDADFAIKIGVAEDDVDSLDTVYHVSEEDEFCDITDFVVDEIKLAIPFKRTHQKDEEGNYLCDNDIASLIDKYEVKNDEKPSDPRWDGLKNIKFN